MSTSNPQDDEVEESRFDEGQLKEALVRAIGCHVTRQLRAHSDPTPGQNSGSSRAIPDTSRPGHFRS